MQNPNEYTPEDFFAENEASAALMEATCDLLKKLQREGLDNCVEFDKGVTALRRWYKQKKVSVGKLERVINQLDESTDSTTGLESQ